MAEASPWVGMEALSWAWGRLALGLESENFYKGLRQLPQRPQMSDFGGKGVGDQRQGSSSQPALAWPP